MVSYSCNKPEWNDISGGLDEIVVSRLCTGCIVSLAALERMTNETRLDIQGMLRARENLCLSRSREVSSPCVVR